MPSWVRFLKHGSGWDVDDRFLEKRRRLAWLGSNKPITRGNGRKICGSKGVIRIRPIFIELHLLDGGKMGFKGCRIRLGSGVTNSKSLSNLFIRIFSPPMARTLIIFYRLFNHVFRVLFRPSCITPFHRRKLPMPWIKCIMTKPLDLMASI